MGGFFGATHCVSLWHFADITIMLSPVAFGGEADIMQNSANVRLPYGRNA
jgi:hypothetical protein